MRILDADNREIASPDMALGRLEEDKILVAHHDAVEAVEEQWHYETIAEYPNGGKDVEKIVDVPGVEEKDAWDEYEDILRYIPYTPEELAEMEAARNQPTQEERIAELENQNQMLTECLMEMSQIVYA